MGLGGAQARWRALAEDTRAAVQETPGLPVLLATTVLSSFVAGLFIPVLPLFLIDKGFSFLQLGGLFSLVAVSAVAVQLVAGKHHRVFARRDVVLACQTLSVLSFPAYLFLDTPLQLLAVTAAATFAASAAGPGLNVLLAEAAPVRRQAAVFGYMGVAGSLAYAAAIVVGYHGSEAGYGPVLYLGTTVSLLSLLLLGLLLFKDRLAGGPRRERQRLTPEEHAALAAARAGLRAARGAVYALGDARAALEARRPRPVQASRNVRWASVHLLLFGVSLAIYPVYFPLYLEQLGLPRGWGGVVIASSWVTFGLCQPFGGRFADRTGKHRALIIASLVAAAALNLAMAAGPLALIVLAWVLLGIADGLGRPVTSALIARSVTAAGMGSAFGWTGAAATAARVVGPYALAFAVMAQGIPYALLIVAALTLAAALPLALIKPIAAPPAAAPSPAGRLDPA